MTWVALHSPFFESHAKIVEYGAWEVSAVMQLPSRILTISDGAQLAVQRFYTDGVILSERSLIAINLGD